MLKDTFFTIQKTDDTENGCSFRITLNASHPIFQAHFAGNPIMPGACIVQVIKELASDYFSRTCFVCAVKNMKFLYAINPLESPEITVQLSFTKQEKERIAVVAILKDGDRIFTKATLLLENISGLQQRMEALRLCIVIPTYNNQKTLLAVLNNILQHTLPVIVINDGSTDHTVELLEQFAGRVQIVSYAPNRGKGHALKTGFDRAEALGYKGAITMDSDGQHFASEIGRFVEYAEKYPDALLIGQRTVEGNMTAGSSFANKFSNFWFTVQTAYRLRDTQNGFRLYPLSAMKGIRPLTSRYEAELEMLVRAAWRGIRIIPVPTRVYYPPESERVTHFRPGKDFLRISLLNTLLTLLAVVYGYPSMFIRRLFTKRKKS